MKILDIAWTKIKIILKDKGSLVWMLLAPILFITIVNFGYDGTDGKFNIAIVDNANTTLSKQMVTELKANGEYPMDVVTFSEGKTKLVDATCIVVVSIQKDFDKIVKGDLDKPAFKLYKVRDHLRIPAIKNLLESRFLQMQISLNIGSISEKVMKDTNPTLTDEMTGDASDRIKNSYKKEIGKSFITVEDEVVESANAEEEKNLSVSTIGIMAIFILAFIVNGGGTILQERKDGVISRLKSTSTSNGTIVAGQALSLFVVGWIQVIVLILIGRYVYKIFWGETAIGIIMIFSAFLAATAMLGILIANLATNRKRFTVLMSIIVFPTSLLGGCMSSKDVMSDLLIKISYFTPQSWFMDGIVDLVIHGNGYESVIKPSLMLLVFAVIFYLLNSLTKKLTNY